MFLHGLGQHACIYDHNFKLKKKRFVGYHTSIRMPTTTEKQNFDESVKIQKFNFYIFDLYILIINMLFFEIRILIKIKTVVVIFFLLAMALTTIVNTRKNHLSFLQTLDFSSPITSPLS